eukprot:490216-Rhodomonas_salina.1
MKAFRIVCVFCGFTFFLHCPQLSHSDIPDDKENREPVPRLYQWDRTALHHRLGFGSKGSAGPDAREEASHGSYYRCVGRQCLLLNVCVLQDRRNADRYQMVFFQSDRPAQLHFEFATDGTDMLNAYLLSKLRRSTWFARTGVSQLADWSIHVESEVGSMPTFHHRTDHDRNPGLVHVLVPGDSLFFAGHTLLSDGFAVFHSMVAFNLLGAEAQILLPRSRSFDNYRPHLEQRNLRFRPPSHRDAIVCIRQFCVPALPHAPGRVSFPVFELDFDEAGYIKAGHQGCNNLYVAASQLSAAEFEHTHAFMQELPCAHGTNQSSFPAH